MMVIDNLHNIVDHRYGHIHSKMKATAYETRRMVANKRADVNASGGNNGGALQGASYNGFELIVRLLLVLNSK